MFANLFGRCKGIWSVDGEAQVAFKQGELLLKHLIQDRGGVLILHLSIPHHVSFQWMDMSARFGAICHNIA